MESSTVRGEAQCGPWAPTRSSCLEDDHIHGIVTTSDLAASLVEHGSAASASAAEQQPPVAEDPPEIGT